MTTTSIMSDDDDFEDLPKIFVNSLVSNTSTFFMPSADELAEQRAREQECEREVRALLERDARGGHADDADSNDSALSDAVRELAVCSPGPAPGAAARYEPSAAALLAALAPALPATARPPPARAGVPACLPSLVGHVSALLLADVDAWQDDDVLSVGALLAAALLAHDSPVRLQATRALHTLLDHRASRAQAEALGGLLGRALEDVRARIELSDALRSVPGSGSDRLATRLRDAALLELLGVPAAQVPAGRVPAAALVDALRAGWAHLEPAAGYRVVQLLGRRLAAAGADERARVLAELSPAPGRAAHCPARLKVLVSVDKLRLLFHTHK